MAQAEIFLAHISEDRERMQTVKEHLLHRRGQRGLSASTD